MYFKKLPKKGDKVKMYVTHPSQIVIHVTPYTGVFKQWFTHVMKYTSPITSSGYNEIAIEVKK